MKAVHVSRVVLVVLLAGWWLPVTGDAGAAVICERTKKKGTKAKLRGDECRSKETQVFDTGDASTGLATQSGRIDQHDQQLSDQGNRVSQAEGKLGQVERQLGFVCEGDPDRVLVTDDISSRLGLLGYLSSQRPSPCRRFDADPAACAGAFTPGSLGVTACVPLLGKCLPCDVTLEATGACTNPCAGDAPTCEADPTRTDFVAACDDLATQPVCERSWELSFASLIFGAVPEGASCHWTGTECIACEFDNDNGSGCTNSCATEGNLPICTDAGRSFGSCGDHDGDAPVCATTYQVGPYGAVSCWFDGSDCERCDPLDELAGRCTNAC